MLVRSLLYIILTLIVMCFISLPLTGVTFAGIAPLVIFTTFYQKWMRALQRRIQDEKGAMNTVAEESFANIRTVKAFSNEEEELKKFEKGSNGVYLAGRTKAYCTALYSMM